MARRIPQRSWVWVDGAPQPGEAARVSVYDRGLLYGDSVYEVTRTVGGQPLWLAAHLARLEASAAGLLMALPPRAQIEAAVAETLAAAGLAEAYVRIVVTRGAGELSLDPDAADEPNLLVYVKPLRLPDATCYQEGVTLYQAEERRDAPGHVPAWIKSGNYLSSVMATAAARRAGAYEALLTDPAGHVAEGASSNLLWARGGRLGTAPLSVGILAGITRAVVLELARETSPVVEELLRPEALLHADEALLTSSVRGVVPVVRLARRGPGGLLMTAEIGDGRPGPLTRWLIERYAARLLAEGRADGAPASGHPRRSPLDER